MKYMTATRKKLSVRKLVSLLMVAVCLFLVCANFIGCQENSSNDSDDAADAVADVPVSISESKAISIAKQSSYVQNKIAKEYGMKFFYTPDWGTVTATDQYSGWEVVLKGTISGYTDDYKSDFIYDKKFTAKVTMSNSGVVSSVYVSRG